MKTIPELRPSPIAGRWYPGDPRRLADSVDGYIDAAGLPELKGEVVAVVVPHAGHIYSGPVAGYAFAALRNLQPEVVAIVSPMHAPYLQSLLTSAHRAYSTPLGNVDIDADKVLMLDEFLQDQLGDGLVPVVNDQEHSLEIQLPFLQRVLAGDFKILPVMVRDVTPRVTQALGHGLAKVLEGSKAILVASTDLSHFYPQHQAQVFDSEMLSRVEALDPIAVLRAEDEGKGFACGRGALAAVLWAAIELGANSAHILHYATSGDVTGDYSQVVGYGAVVITR